MTSGSLVEPVDDPRCFYVLCHSIRLISSYISRQPLFFLRLIRFSRIVFAKISVLSLENLNLFLVIIGRRKRGEGEGITTKSVKKFELSK